MIGKVVRLVRDRGFGFIRAVDGTNSEYFFHYTAVKREPGFDFERLAEGTEVEFDIGSGPKGPRAENIVPA